MKMLAIAAAVLAAAVPAYASQADIDAMDAGNAWKVTDVESGKTELVFDPVTVRDWDTRTEWISAVACDIELKECYSFDFNPKQIQMTKVPQTLVKAWKQGKVKAF